MGNLNSEHRVFLIFNLKLKSDISVDKAEQWIGNTFGEEALERFKIFSKNLSTLINGFIVWKLVFEKIFKSF